MEDDSEERKAAKAKDLEERSPADSRSAVLTMTLFTSFFIFLHFTSGWLAKWKNKKNACGRPILRKVSRLDCRLLRIRARRYLPELQQRWLCFQEATATVIDAQPYANLRNYRFT